jgi:GntR family transcriptional repressor for pyruvate dehydrogenase complex
MTNRRPLAKSAKGPLRNAVVARLKSYIASRGLKPGDRLPTEEELAKRFGVSRVSVREAIQPLRYLGILRSAPRRGLTVGTMEVERLGECLDFHALIETYPAEQLLRAREAMEVGAIPHAIAALRDEPGLYERLKAITEDPRLITDADAYIDADIAFHRELMAATNIGPLAFFDRLLEAFFRRFRERAAGPGPDSRVQGVRHHRRILDALRSGDPAVAEAEIRQGFSSYLAKTGR